MRADRCSCIVSIYAFLLFWSRNSSRFCGPTGGLVSCGMFERAKSRRFGVTFTMIGAGLSVWTSILLSLNFIKRLHKRYQQEGIENPFPIRTIYMKQLGE